jgi:hypothetical protein
MNDEEKNEAEEIGRIRSEIQDVRSDILDVKETYSDDKPNAGRVTKHRLAKHKNKIAILGIIAILGVFWFGDGIPQIPQWSYIAVACVGIGAFISYPFARYVADRFVTDDRRPVTEINPPGEKEFHLYYVPKERIPDMESAHGEKTEIQTKKGEGYEVSNFETYNDEGKQRLLYEGYWVAEKSNLDLRRDYANIQGMRESLVPLAKKGFRYEVMMPNIIHEISADVANSLAREFESAGLFKGDEVRRKIDGRIESYDFDKLGDKIQSASMEDMEEFQSNDATHENGSGIAEMISDD